MSSTEAIGWNVIHGFEEVLAREGAGWPLVAQPESNDTIATTQIATPRFFAEKFMFVPQNKYATPSPAVT